jgi:hypothetical protein
MHTARVTKVSAALLALTLGCAAEIEIGPGDYTKTGDDKSDTSAEAIFVQFAFDAELVASSSWNPNSRIEDQLLYTIGQLNGDGAVGRLDQLELSNVATETEGGKTLQEQRSVLAHPLAAARQQL